jgi:alkyl sulfatase BDS1-like metallo-beta-lactamase superfamily hydrolase
LHYANQGVAINQIHNVYQLPASLWKQWPAHSYHGSSEHNSRGVINRFLGYWDGNPATLIPLSPEDAAPLYVEMMGGPAKIMAKGKKLYDQGKYLEASEILNRLVFAQPKNQAAKNLLADVFEQIGYQKESPSLRNSFLQGAYELRTGLPGGVPARSSGPDVVRAMSTENWLDFLGISVDPKKAEGMAFVINLVTPDNGENYLVEMSNATLTNIKGEQAKKPDLTITLNRTELDQVMMGASTLDDLVKAGKAKFEGDRKPYDQLKSLLVTFAPNFEIMPGTANASAKTVEKPDPNPLKVPDLMPADSAGD